MKLYDDDNDDDLDETVIKNLNDMSNAFIKYCMTVSDNEVYESYMLNSAAKLLVASFADKNGDASFNEMELDIRLDMIKETILCNVKLQD